MENNTQSRKWALVINNPLEAGLDHAAIREILYRFSPAYFCMADEIATTGTYHTHIFLFSPSPMRFSTVKNRFSTAHIEKAYGSAKANRAYILKEGHWADTDKAETSVSGTFEEWGDLPAEKEEEAPEMFKLIQDLRAGKSVMEIIEDNPKLAFRIREIETLRQAILEEKYSAENRALEVTYLYGASGTGKTRGIFEKHLPYHRLRRQERRPLRRLSLSRCTGAGGISFANPHQRHAQLSGHLSADTSRTIHRQNRLLYQSLYHQQYPLRGTVPGYSAVSDGDMAGVPPAGAECH